MIDSKRTYIEFRALCILLDFELKCVGDSLVPEAHFTAARVRVL